MVRLGLKDVRWFVLGDDDTVFSPENLVRVLAKYDHTEMHYIGSSSESHVQNVKFSYNMAYGGGGFAISYPLAKALEQVQDSCLKRHAELFGSDDRMQACMAELGIPLTKEPGFHQLDIYGNAFGILAAHPVAPFVSLHHVELIDPIFPNKSVLAGLRHLSGAMHMDPGSFLQHSYCYDHTRKWSISVAWGFAVQVFPGIVSARELERPEMTFQSWYRQRVTTEFTFNTRSPARHACLRPSIFFMEDISCVNASNEFVSVYARNTDNDMKKVAARCSSLIRPPQQVQRFRITKQPIDEQWFKAPRRYCCQLTPPLAADIIDVHVHPCAPGEVIA
eukprot:SM000003S11230  [mRNA]  locus=s3:1737090:1738823:+ [translate_table: standard]